MKIVLTDYGISVTEAEPSLVSGSVGTYQCTITADAEHGTGWTGLAKIAVFDGAGKRVQVSMGSSDTVTVPWEVLAKPGTLKVGVYGTGNDGKTIRVTAFAVAGEIVQGVTSGDTAKDPSATLYQQLSSQVEQLQTLVSSIQTQLGTMASDLKNKQDATGVYLSMGTDSEGKTTPQVVVE